MTTEAKASVSSLPVILVYSFDNLSSSESGGNFSIAFTESVISSLSSYRGISVFSSSTSMDAKTKAAKDPLIKVVLVFRPVCSLVKMDQGFILGC